MSTSAPPYPFVPRPCTAATGLPLPRLLEPTPAALAQLACILATRVELWRPLLHVDPEHRWYARIAGGEGWEAWLHTWLPGQTTGEHPHSSSAGGESAGAFTVLSGAVEERLGGAAEGTVYRSPQVRSFDGGHRHELVGRGDGPSASLHVYAPPLR